MSQNTFGVPEPHHVKERVAEIEERRKTKHNEPWVNMAPKYQGDINLRNPSKEFLAWQRIERDKIYRSVDSRTGEIFLVRNVDALDWRWNPNGTLTMLRTTPIPTGEFVKRTRAAAKHDYGGRPKVD